MKDKKTILVFGNPLVKLDSLAINLIPKLKVEFPNINFIHADPTENLDKYGKDLLILDVANVKEVKVLTLNDNFESLSTSKIFSMHDFDLGYNLKLLKSIGRINSARIICLPMTGTEDSVWNELKNIIKSF